jgi:hypothetical protein
MSKTPKAAAEPIDVDNKVDIDGIDWEQEAQDADRLFGDWTSVKVEVLPCALPAPVPVPPIEESRYFLRSSVKVSTFHTIKPTACARALPHTPKCVIDSKFCIVAHELFSAVF